MNPGPGRWAGELHAVRVVLCGRREAPAPPDLRATAVRAERLVFAAALLTAAITLSPPRNPRGAERRGKSVASGESDSGALRRAVRGKTAPAPRCQAGKGKAGWTLGETAAREYGSVRTRDAFCAGPLSFCLLRAEAGVWPREKVSRYGPVALMQEQPRRVAWNCRGQEPQGTLKVRTEGPICWRPLTGGATYPKPS